MAKQHLPAIVRFLSRIEPQDSGCWLWTARLNEGGYGMVSVQGRHTRAHRFAYEFFVGPIPEGLVIDHLCNVPRCVNPDHLRAVTHRENVMAPHSRTPQRLLAERTHCWRGHELAGPNLRTDNRGCRACHNIAARARYATAKEMVA